MAIQPKNTPDIKVNSIVPKSGSDLDLNSILRFSTALLPLSATIDFGSSTAAEHVRELFAKTISSNGQAMTLGTDSAHSLNFKSNDLSRAAINSSGALVQDSTNGSDLDWSQKSGTYVALTCSFNLTATGTLISDALDLVSTFNFLTTVAASTGAQLPDSLTNSIIFGLNAGANALALYPHSGTGTINGGGAGSSVSIANGSAFIAWRESSTNWIAREWVLGAA